MDRIAWDTVGLLGAALGAGVVATAGLGWWLVFS